MKSLIYSWNKQKKLKEVAIHSWVELGWKGKGNGREFFGIVLPTKTQNAQSEICPKVIVRKNRRRRRKSRRKFSIDDIKVTAQERNHFQFQWFFAFSFYLKQHNADKTDNLGR